MITCHSWNISWIWNKASAAIPPVYFTGEQTVYHRYSRLRVRPQAPVTAGREISLNENTRNSIRHKERLAKKQTSDWLTSFQTVVRLHKTRMQLHLNFNRTMIVAVLWVCCRLVSSSSSLLAANVNNKWPFFAPVVMFFLCFSRNILKSSPGASRMKYCSSFSCAIVQGLHTNHLPSCEIAHQ